MMTARISSAFLTLPLILAFHCLNKHIAVGAFNIFDSNHNKKNYGYSLQKRNNFRKVVQPLNEIGKESHNYNEDDNGSEKDEVSSSFVPQLLKLASTHFTSQALHAAIRLKILNILNNEIGTNSNNKDGLNYYSINDIAESIIESTNNNRCNKDALLRTMRLLSTVDIVQEKQIDNNLYFSLTKLGRCFCNVGFASCVLHWMEKPLWDSWLYLPDYIVQENSNSGIPSPTTPFEYANGITSDEYYNEKDHPKSLEYANTFVTFIHEQEIYNVVNGFDWELHCKNKKVMDVGGFNGSLLKAIIKKVPSIDCAYCLDLPQVIEKVAANAKEYMTDDGTGTVVTMIPGNIFQPETIPNDCNVIIMKHFLDRCMWDDDETIKILKTCSNLVVQNVKGEGEKGKIIVIDAVVPDFIEDCDSGGNEPSRLKKELTLYLDAFYMMSGRNRQRTESEWKELAHSADLDIIDIEYTNIPTCSMIVMEPMF